MHDDMIRAEHPDSMTLELSLAEGKRDQGQKNLHSPVWSLLWSTLHLAPASLVESWGNDRFGRIQRQWAYEPYSWLKFRRWQDSQVRCAEVRQGTGKSQQSTCQWVSHHVGDGGTVPSWTCEKPWRTHFPSGRQGSWGICPLTLSLIDEGGQEMNSSASRVQQAPVRMEKTLSRRGAQRCSRWGSSMPGSVCLGCRQTQRWARREWGGTLIAAPAWEWYPNWSSVSDQKRLKEVKKIQNLAFLHEGIMFR